jgi:hypothetical protein
MIFNELAAIKKRVQAFFFMSFIRQVLFMQKNKGHFLMTLIFRN